MTGQSKMFPPSDHRLSELRRAGIVPFSRDVVTFAVAGAVLLAVWLLSGEWLTRLAGAARSGFQGRMIPWREMLIVGAAGAGAFAGAAALAALGAGLLQTKFLFTVNPAPANSGPGRRLVLCAAGIVKAAAVWGIAGLLLYGLAYEFVRPEQIVEWQNFCDRVFQPQTPPAAPLLERLRLVSGTAAALLVVTALFFAVISRFVVVTVFRSQHSMSRLEMEAEAKDLEMKSEVKQAQRERRGE